MTARSFQRSGRTSFAAGRKIRRALVTMALAAAVLVFPAGRDARAASCCSCVATSTAAIIATILEQHIDTRTKVSDEMTAHQKWMVDTFFSQHLLRAMMMMTDQLTAVAMQQVEIIGMFLDAKHQLETQRLFQQLQAQAHKDYHPSEDLCSFGTVSEDLAASDRISEYNAVALSQNALQRQLNSNARSSAIGKAGDRTDRLQKFITTYCNPSDNNDGLDIMCGAGGAAARRNNDVDFTRMIDAPMTLQVNYTDGAAAPDEQDVIALSNNLYGHDVMDPLQEQYLKNPATQEVYLDMRQVVAKRSVAQNSFNAIVGMKSRGSGNAQSFMAAILKELSLPDDQALALVGDHPSYFAQMELLTKKIYQNPDFYANLYDKPVNVARKGVAMQAIQLMQDRDMYRSQIRSEMLLSLLLEMEVRKLQEDVQGKIDEQTGRSGGG